MQSSDEMQERNPRDDRNENDEWSKILLALLFLLLSFACIFCSSSSALYFIDRDQIEVSMLSDETADYELVDIGEVGALDASGIATARAIDEIQLTPTGTPEPRFSGVPSIAILPVPTFTPEPAPPPFLVTPTPAAVSQLPTEEAGPPTSGPPTNVPPTNAPPTQAPPTEAPPTKAPPTAAPPTEAPPPTAAPPTVAPPTVAPTVPPATVPPATVPPTSVPPTQPPPTDSPDDPTPVPISVQFTTTNFNVDEGAGAATISVNLSATSETTITVTYDTFDNTATQGTDYTRVNSSLTFPPGNTIQSFTVPIIDDTADEVNELVDLQLISIVQGTNVTLGTPNPATLTIIDNDIPTIQFSSNSYTVNEAAGTATLTVTLNIPAAQDVTVNYATSDNTAVAGTDYTASSGTVSIVAGGSIGTFTVPIINDLLDEPDEAFIVTLSGPINATLGTPNPASVTIVDDDTPPLVRFSSTNYDIYEGQGSATITVTLSAASANPIQVNYSTTDGTAAATTDYTAQAGTLSFSAGQTLTTFTVPIINDTTLEPSETVNLNLTAPLVNVSLGTPNPAILTILDDDTTVRFSQVNYDVLEDTGTATITVTLSAALTSDATVNYNTSDGSATAPTDYTAVGGTLTIPTGQTVVTFTIPIIDDTTTTEPAETINLTLSSPSINISLGTPNPATATILDNPVRVGFTSSEYGVNEDNDGGNGFVDKTITITLSRASAVDVFVDYGIDTPPGSATGGGVDYNDFSGTVTFNSPQTLRTFTVRIQNDATSELPSETINMLLSNPINAVASPDTSILRIYDDDGATTCSPGSIPPGEPDQAAPDGTIALIDCTTELVIPLSTSIIVDGNNDDDLIYYELGEASISGINMDQVIVEVGASSTGPWYTVFYWGDGVYDLNTNVGTYCNGSPTTPCTGEPNNFDIPQSILATSALPIASGITIDVDARAPVGTYSHIRFYSPLTVDPAEVDAIVVLP